ncbi:MAG: hypothetical protein ACTHU0_07345, partial [Kofleriaceae bacterium]
MMMIIIVYAFGVMFVLLALVLLFRALAAPPVTPEDDPIPRAQITSDGKSHLPSTEPRRRKRSVLPRVFGSLAIGGLGASIIAFVYSITHLDLGGSKGRILRLNGKAALPTRATGTAWSDDAAPHVQHLSKAERATLAELWTLSAQMEHASVPAFSQLSLHLAALGGPNELVERTPLAPRVQIRHTR